jgi:hypothetical protein
MNWTINGRTLLAMAPAIGILIARNLKPNSRVPAIALPLVAGACVSLAVAWGDYRLAAANEEAAARIAERATRANARLIVSGHWGFQYYIEQAGYESYGPNLKYSPGNIIVVPDNSPGTFYPTKPIPRSIVQIKVPASSWITTMRRDVGAGFYSHFWGPLPYYFGRVLPERYVLYELGSRKR